MAGSVITHGDVEAPIDASPIRAAFIDVAGASPRLGPVELPQRTRGTTLVRVLAAPLNPLDLAIASGSFHSVRHDAPYVPGSECVGVVVASDRFAVGSVVYGECHASPAMPGSFAAQTLIPDESLLELPDGLDPVPAAAVGNAGVAAFLPLVMVAGVRPGETVLVLGATGAVGRLAVQIARQHGAGQVVAVGRDHEALEQLIELGADSTVDLRPEESADELAARLLAAGGPVHVVLDGVYGTPLEAALRTCAPGARVVNIGNAAGATAEVPAGLLRGRQITLSGFAGLHVPLHDKGAALTWLWTALRDERLHVDVRTFRLEEVAEAWTRQAASPHGKAVLVLDDKHQAHPQPARSNPSTTHESRH